MAFISCYLGMIVWDKKEKGTDKNMSPLSFRFSSSSFLLGIKM